MARRGRPGGGLDVLVLAIGLISALLTGSMVVMDQRTYFNNNSCIDEGWKETGRLPAMQDRSDKSAASGVRFHSGSAARSSTRHNISSRPLNFAETASQEVDYLPGGGLNEGVSTMRGDIAARVSSGRERTCPKPPTYEDNLRPPDARHEKGAIGLIGKCYTCHRTHGLQEEY